MIVDRRLQICVLPGTASKLVGKPICLQAVPDPLLHAGLDDIRGAEQPRIPNASSCQFLVLCRAALRHANYCKANQEI